MQLICKDFFFITGIDDYFVDRFTKEHFSFKLTLFIYVSYYSNNMSFTWGDMTWTTDFKLKCLYSSEYHSKQSKEGSCLLHQSTTT